MFDPYSEDVAADRSIFPGRVVALAIPTDAVAPLTIELHTFDRAWYVAHETQDSYVRSESKPFATLAVPAN